MRKRLSVSFALVLLAASPALYPQSSAGSESVDSQQNPSAACTDSLSSMSEECAQSQEQAPRENLGVEPTRPNGVNTSAPSESTTLGGQTRTQPQQRFSALAPDPPTEFQKFVAATTGQLLPVYGANLFRNVPLTFAPIDLAPVTAKYVIGPDDELRVRIWGQINYSGNLRVDRSGNIYLPQVGEVHVAGFEFSALDQHLRAAVGRIYRNFDLSVDIGRIRSIEVYVTGQARRPGDCRQRPNGPGGHAPRFRRRKP